MPLISCGGCKMAQCLRRRLVRRPDRGLPALGGHRTAAVVDSGRLEAFSDGVFAVAITLLALDLVISGPSSVSLATKLAAIWPAFAAYAVSFATIASSGSTITRCSRTSPRSTGRLLFVNLPVLFFVVSIPFATSTIAAYLREGGASASLAAAIYEGVFEGVSISFALLLWQAIRHEHLKVALTASRPAGPRSSSAIGNIGYIAAIGVAFVSPPASLAISGLVAVYYIFEQTPARDQPAPGADGSLPEDQAGS